MAVQDQPGLNPADPHVIDGLKLLRAFVKIADVADRRKVMSLPLHCRAPVMVCRRR